MSSVLLWKYEKLIILLLGIIIISLWSSDASFIGRSRRRLTFPLGNIDHSIIENDTLLINAQQMNKIMIMPTGMCSDMRDRDLILNIPGLAPRHLFSCFIDSYRVSCLSMPDSLIENIAIGAFDALPNLLYLDISRNRIEFCNLLTFGGHDKLKTLVYDENQSQGQQNNLILTNSGYFPKLENLYLRKNYLRDIRVSLRKYMPSLTHLYLSDNCLNGETFNNLQLPYTLTHLHLERNWIDNLGCRNININCELASINLVSLFLDGNRIKTLCSDFCRIMENYRQYNHQLNLRGIAGSRLEFLSISRNEIEFIDRNTFEDTTNLKSLNLAHNYIKNILPGTLDILQSLRDLSLSYNQINTLPDFHNVIMLTSLSLDHNQIQKIQSYSFSQLNKLKWLTLGANRIISIEKYAFINLPLLEELDLSDNQLSYLPRDWTSGVSSLRHLDIRGNHFTNIESMNIDNILTLTHLYVQDNPLSSTIIHNYEALYPRHNNQNITLYFNRNNNGIINCHYYDIIPRFTFSNEWSIAK